MKFGLLLAFGLVYCCQISDCREPYQPYGSFGEWESSPNDESIGYSDHGLYKPMPYPSGKSLSYDPQPAWNSDIPISPRAVSVDPNSVTDDELLQLSEILYSKENSLLDQIVVNFQGKTRSIDTNDVAPEPLLEVSETILRTPTIAKMVKLFDNYEMDAAVPEVVTSAKLREQDDFLEAVMATNVMRQAMIFLQTKGIVSSNLKTQQNLLKTLWFTIYSRGGGILGSSGFEHVFLNEINKGKIIGLHNWVYFNKQEQAGLLDYKGYINKLALGSKAETMEGRFEFRSLNKPVNSLFLGTTPEMELALYTICFQFRPDSKCPVSLGGKKFFIQTHSWRYNGNMLVGAAYPKLH